MDKKKVIFIRTLMKDVFVSETDTEKFMNEYNNYLDFERHNNESDSGGIKGNRKLQHTP